MPTLARPQVDVLEGLTTAIIVDQQRMGGDARSTVGTATDANAMLRVLFSRLGQPHIGSPNAFSFNVASVRASGAITIERGEGKTVRKAFARAGGMCPRCEGRGTVSDMDLTQLFDDSKSLAEGAIIIPGYTVDNFFAVRPYIESGILDPDKPIRKYTKKELHDFLHHEPIKVKVNGVNVTYEGLIPKIQRSFLSKDAGAAAAHPGVRRPGRHLHCVPRLRGHPAQRGGTVVTDRRGQHRRHLRDADQRPGRMGPRRRRAVGGAAAGDPATDPGLVRGDRPRVPLARPADGHPVGWRGPARQDPPPGLLAHRRHLRPRRAHGGPAPPRHRADERAAATATGQGQHGARRGARAGHDLHRRPRGRPRPRRWSRGRHRLFRGHRRGVAGQWHRHRSPSRRPGRPQGRGADPHRQAGDPRGDDAQPARRGRRHPARRARRHHGRRRLRQELPRARIDLR